MISTAYDIEKQHYGISQPSFKIEFRGTGVLEKLIVVQLAYKFHIS
jgi:hypothetical protein